MGGGKAGLFLPFRCSAIARNQGAAGTAAQRPTAPSGGRYCNVSSP